MEDKAEMDILKIMRKASRQVAKERGELGPKTGNGPHGGSRRQVSRRRRQEGKRVEW